MGVLPLVKIAKSIYVFIFQQVDLTCRSHTLATGVHRIKENIAHSTAARLQLMLREYQIRFCNLFIPFGLRSLSRRHATANFGTVVDMMPHGFAKLLYLRAFVVWAKLSS